MGRAFRIPQPGVKTDAQQALRCNRHCAAVLSLATDMQRLTPTWIHVANRPDCVVSVVSRHGRASVHMRRDDVHGERCRAFRMCGEAALIVALIAMTAMVGILLALYVAPAPTSPVIGVAITALGTLGGTSVKTVTQIYLAGLVNASSQSEKDWTQSAKPRKQQSRKPTVSGRRLSLPRPPGGANRRRRL